MSEIRELSFCELRRKDIVSINDGRKLGRIVDLVCSSSSGKVQGIVAPYGKKFLCFRSQEVYIPYCNIKTIGEDIILVDIAPELGKGHPEYSRPDSCRSDRCRGGDSEHRYERCERPHNQDHYNDNSDKCDENSECDGRCDKCMLFDCSDRWKKKHGVYVDNAPYN